MNDPVDQFYEAYEEAEAAFRSMHAALRRGGVDLAESRLAQKLRSAETLIEIVRDDIEANGLDGEDES